MAQEKILEYLEAELEDTMRQKPNREEYLTDYEYDTECIAWDNTIFILNKIIDSIKHYDDEEDMKRYVDNLIKNMKEE